MINRLLQKEIESKFFKGKAILLIGPRQVGKKTLIQEILKGKDHLFLNGDDLTVISELSGADTFKLKTIIGAHTIVFIDEAQRIPNIGIVLKIITDQFKQVQLLVSGSSAFEINDAMQESLTGRKWTYYLYPISWEELESKYGYLETTQQLEHRLIFGMYPDVINNPGNEFQVLKELASSYLYKDVLQLSAVRKPVLLDKLLKALALQLGSEVSYNELANLLEVDKATVIRYIELLEKSYIIFQLNSFSRNQRNEIKNNRKIYFYDNGIRNMIISNLNSFDLRADKEALWENFLISERKKKNAYHQYDCNSYFWRTQSQQEIDYIEDYNGSISAFEFKWKKSIKNKMPASFFKSYQAIGAFIDKENYREFVMG